MCVLRNIDKAKEVAEQHIHTHKHRLNVLGCPTDPMTLRKVTSEQHIKYITHAHRHKPPKKNIIIIEYMINLIFTSIEKW